MAVDLNIMVGGEAGQGIQTIGFILGKALSRGGLHVFTDQDYESRVRRGHNFFRVRVKDIPVECQTEKLDMLVALDKNTLDLHIQELKADGLIFADAAALQIETGEKRLLDIPLEKIAVDAGASKLMSNTVAVGAVLGVFGFDFEILADVIRWNFARYSREVQEDNIKAARAGYDFALDKVPQASRLNIGSSRVEDCVFINGSEAVSLGAMAAGCKFLAGYPMTPTSPIIEYIADKGRDHDITVIQPEDEIAAINMVLGAAFTGVRAMTATSGSGFALMVEALGFAGIAEIPCVVALGQRPGPAVGLPTRTEQGELLLAVRVGTGEFPRAVLAPANMEEAFYLTAKAFNLAEKYQLPVIILTDTHLANSFSSVAKFDLDKIRIDRGDLISVASAAGLKDYHRFAVTESGVSPRLIPGSSRFLVAADSDEHDPDGHMTESAQIRNEQVAKRLRKYQGLSKNMGQPYFQSVPDAALTLIGWGSTLGAIKEASSILKSQGLSSNVLHLSEIWPFPVDAVASALKQTPRSVMIENNATGQMASLLHSQTGIQVSARINKFDGRPVSPQFIIDELKKGVI